MEFFPRTFPISSHFTHFLYMTVALLVNPRVGKSVYILSPCKPFKWSLLKIQQFLPSLQSPLVFIAEVMGIYPLHWNPGSCGLAWAWDCSLPRYPSWFLSITRECGTTHALSASSAASVHHTSPLCPSLHLCPSYLSGWMWLFKIFCCQTYIQFNFLTVLGIVLRFSCNSFCGCSRRQSMPPSWLEVLWNFL